MSERTHNIEQVLELARSQGVVRLRDLAAKKLHREAVRRAYKRGELIRVGRGLYSLPDAEVTEHRSLVEAAKRVPSGVVCLLSALRFHGMTTQLPFEVWLTIDRKARLPAEGTPPLRVVRASGQAQTHGVEEHALEGVQVRITSPAKTVADCFKYRNKIGLDVALEALRDYTRRRKGSADALWAAARACRVANVMRPYTEAMS